VKPSGVLDYQQMSPFAASTGITLQMIRVAASSLAVLASLASAQGGGPRLPAPVAQAVDGQDGRPLLRVFVGTFRGDAGETTAGLVRADLQSSGAVEVISFESSDGYGIHAEATGGWIDAVIFKPDGRVLLQRRYESPNLRQNVHRLTDDFTEIVTQRPGIAGSVIAFVSDNSGKRQVYLCDSDGADIRQVTIDPEIEGIHPNISLMNGRIVYTAIKHGFADIWAVDLVTEESKRLINAPGDNLHPTLSPDGERLAVTMSYSGTTDLYVTTALGGRARRLTQDAAMENSPSWSPDGRHVAFARTNEEGHGAHICYVSSLGGVAEVLPVAEQAESSEPDWSPDGQNIAFTIGTDPTSQIAVFTMSTRKTAVLGETEGGHSPSWAPDSRHLVYLKDNALWVVDVESRSKRTKIAGDFGNVSEPAWSR
jgi:TolB protein